MGDPALQAQIDSASVYERLFVPAEFQEWAPRMIAAAQIQSGHRVLDVAVVRSISGVVLCSSSLGRWRSTRRET